MSDWRPAARRREIWQRFYTFHLRYRTHPGCVYFWLPAIAGGLDLDADQRAWLAWLNGNTQNPVTSLLLLSAAPTPDRWADAVTFWRGAYKRLAWDTDRRHQKARFGEATEAWAADYATHPAKAWETAASDGWEGVWRFAVSQPHMGRLSAWSMIEYARLLLPGIPDADTLLLGDLAGSRSHRNALGLLDGHDDAVYWSADATTPDYREHLADLGAELLAEARQRNPGHPDVGYLTLESALCTYKSWHKPNRRYPNVYADMAHARLLHAEARFGRRFDLLWEARAKTLPPRLRLEATPTDPGCVPLKQNHYLRTGEPVMMHGDWPDLANDFNDGVTAGRWGTCR